MTSYKGYANTFTLAANTETNIYGGMPQGERQSTIAVTVIGAGTVYLKVVPYASSITGLVSSTNYTAYLTSSDTTTLPFQITLAPGFILVAISSSTPDVKVYEVVEVA